MERAIYPVLCFQWVTWLAAVRTWLAQGAKYLIFLVTEKNRGVFCEFYARFFRNARFIWWSARAFSWNRTRVNLHPRPRPQRTIWIEHSHWSIFEFMAHDFPKTSYMEYIAHSILSSPPYYLLLLLLDGFSQLREDSMYELWPYVKISCVLNTGITLI